MSIDTPSIPPQANGANGYQFTEAPVPTAPIDPVDRAGAFGPPTEWPWSKDDAAPILPEAAPETKAPAGDAEADGHGRSGRKRFALKRRTSPEPKTAQVKQPSKAPKAPKEAKPRRKGEFPRWALFLIVPFFAVYYIAFFAGATIGQAFVLSSEKVVASLPGEHNFELNFATAAVIGGMLEFASVGLMIFSLIVRIEGERGTFIKWFSRGLAAIAVGLNSIGHLWIGDIVGAVIYTLCSAVAFVSAGEMIEFFMRRIQIARGRRLVPRPPYPWKLRLKQPQLVRLAGELFDENPDLELLGSLKAARAKLEAERRETDRIEREMKEQARRDEEIKLIEGLLFEMAFDEFGDERSAKIQVLADGPAETVKRLVAMGDPDAAAARLRARMDRQRDEMTESRARRVAADMAAEKSAEFLPTHAPNSTPNKASKLARLAVRVGLPVGSDSNLNAVPNESPINQPNSAPTRTRKATADSVPNNADSGSRVEPIKSDTAEIVRVTGDEGKDRARAYLLQLLAEGKELPGATWIEREFGIADPQRSKGKIGGDFKKQVLAEYEARLKEAKK
jgi:hypothetical protein